MNSSTSSKKVQKITTTTSTTNIGDIGLTGQTATELIRLAAGGGQRPIVLGGLGGGVAPFTGDTDAGKADAGKADSQTKALALAGAIAAAYVIFS